jgi:hypothetical protein
LTHGESYDVVAVGSSHSYRSLDPRTLDARLRELGVPVVSYNLGLPGTSFPETVYTVEWILRNRPERLKVLIIELKKLDVDVRSRNSLTRRTIRWHTPSMVLALCQAALRSGRAWDEKAKLVLARLRHLGYKIGSVGIAASFLQEKTRPSDRTRRMLLFDLRGHRAADRDPKRERMQERRRDLLENPLEWHRRLENARRRAENRRTRPAYLELVEDLAARVRSAGVEPVFLLPPNLRVSADPPLDPDALDEVFAYDDPSRHPALYHSDLWFDLGHLNSHGAALFSRLFAQDLGGRLETVEIAGLP